MEADGGDELRRAIHATLGHCEEREKVREIRRSRGIEGGRRRRAGGNEIELLPSSNGGGCDNSGEKIRRFFDDIFLGF
jgi:hypothetical protein